MKDKIVMSKTNGEVGVAIPLFRVHHDESLGKMEGFSVWLSKSEPLAYVVDVGHGLTPQILNAETVKRHLEFLGDL